MLGQLNGKEARMNAPVIKHFTRDEAVAELDKLRLQLGLSDEEAARRARNYELSGPELGLWERISDLRWLIGR